MADTPTIVILRPSDKAWKKARAAAVKFAERIAPIYAMLDWRWHDENLVPGALEIAKSLRQMLTEMRAEIEAATDAEIVARGYRFCHGTGGLAVTVEIGCHDPDDQDDAMATSDIALSFEDSVEVYDDIEDAMVHREANHG